MMYPDGLWRCADCAIPLGPFHLGLCKDNRNTHKICRCPEHARQRKTARQRSRRFVVREMTAAPHVEANINEASRPLISCAEPVALRIAKAITSPPAPAGETAPLPAFLSQAFRPAPRRRRAVE